jgi:hypothetical protein
MSIYIYVLVFSRLYRGHDSVQITCCFQCLSQCCPAMHTFNIRGSRKGRTARSHIDVKASGKFPKYFAGIYKFAQVIYTFPHFTAKAVCTRFIMYTVYRILLLFGGAHIAMCKSVLVFYSFPHFTAKVFHRFTNQSQLQQW